MLIAFPFAFCCCRCLLLLLMSMEQQAARVSVVPVASALRLLATSLGEALGVRHRPIFLLLLQRAHVEHAPRGCGQRFSGHVPPAGSGCCAVTRRGTARRELPALTR